MRKQYRTGILILAAAAMLVLAGCEAATPPPKAPPKAPPPETLAYAQRWWNVLTGEQRVAALYGTKATEEQEKAAQKGYGALDAATKKKVNEAARDLYGEYESVEAWWKKLDCKQKRIAVGEGNEVDLASPYCADYQRRAEPRH